MSTSYDEQRRRQDTEQWRPSTQKGYGYSTLSPTTRQTVKFLTATTLGTVLLILSGLILTGTVLSLILATPVLILFSPVLLPAAFTVFLLACSFVFSGTCGVAALSALSWIYQYSTGHHPPGSHHLDRGRFGTSGGAMSDVDKEKSSYY